MFSVLIIFTNYRRSNDRSYALKQQQESEGICQLIKSQEVHKDDARKSDVGPACDAEDGAVDGLGGVGLAEHTQSHRDTADDETRVVEIETVDPGSVREPAQQQAGHCVGDPDNREEEGGLVNLDIPGSGAVLSPEVLTSTL